MNTTQPTAEQIAEARELLGGANDEALDGMSLNYHGLQALRVLLAATAPADDAATYTPDELDFLDKAIIHLAAGCMADPAIKSITDLNLRRMAEHLLAERRAIRGLAKVLDEESAKRLDVLYRFYEGARSLVGCLQADPNGIDSPFVLTSLEDQRRTLHERSSQLVNTSLANDELKRRIEILTAERMAAQSALDATTDRLQRTEQDLGEKQKCINELETKLVNQAPKVKEWLDAIDAMCEAWPRDVPYKDNPTLAEWIRDLVPVLGEKAKRQTAEALGMVRKRIESALGMPMSGLLDIIERKHALRAVDEELAALDPNPHDGCLDCNGTGWVNGIVGSACDVPRKAPTRQ
jgi:hypothetical protein